MPVEAELLAIVNRILKAKSVPADALSAMARKCAAKIQSDYESKSKKANGKLTVLEYIATYKAKMTDFIERYASR